MKKQIAIIGGGNLGQALARGFLDSKYCEANDLIVTRRHTESLNDWINRGVQITSDNQAACQKADIILFCVQPRQLLSLLKELKPVLTNKQTIVSTVTGISLKDIEQILGNDKVIFRAMPNTAVAIRESMTGSSAPKTATKEKQTEITELFKNVGEAIIIEEEQMASATVLAACGIAFALRYIRATAQGGIEVGFESDLAHKIAAQTVKGAAQLLQETGHHPESEIDRVTTPQGCTIAGLNEMEHRGFSSALIKGISTSFNKIAKIATDSHKDS